ncbi:hypothetical protein [Mesorhizobium sp. CCNWLW176]|uniref:hypothetical protein n=1 Tax=unclassified Mesorhizobium TaxID=325217 RepID=UPI003FA56DB3
MSGRTEGGGDAGRRPTSLLPTLTFLACIAIFLNTSPAFAHASDRGYVLLMPTGYYLTGGAMAVAASFLVLAVLPPALLERFAAKRLAFFSVSERARTFTSLIAFAILATLIAAGFLGSRDPLSNPLPLTIWTLLWVGLTLVQGVFGNLWAWINPWYGPWRVVAAIFPTLRDRRLPKWAGYWPALILFFAFAWFELIDPAPDDPARLAWAAGIYWLVSFLAVIAFGYEDWSRRGEFLSVFFRMVSRFGMVEAARPENRTSLCLPGAKLWAANPLPASGMFFLLLSLSSVSFDGLSKTFFWLGLNGINPLEFPGRSAVMTTNTIGLVLIFAALSAVYLLAVLLGERLAGSRLPFARSAGLLVWSIVPIALAYHFSHYLTAFLVNGQYALVAISDPFSSGWDVFGTAGFQVGAGIVAGYQSAWALWNAQAAAIIGGHVLAVLIAHGLAYRLHPTARQAALSQLPLTILMIGYTVFGLWLLSTPTAG